MKIIVFAEQFSDGCWDVWEHACTPQEVRMLVDCAMARADDRTSDQKPTHEDFLAGAHRLFDVVNSPARERDTRVYCVCIDQIVIGEYEKIRKYAERIAEAHEYDETALRKSA
jgi:hypothetical protein